MFSLLERELEGAYNTVYKDFTGKKGKKVEYFLAQQERHLNTERGTQKSFNCKQNTSLKQ